MHKFRPAGEGGLVDKNLKTEKLDDKLPVHP